MPGIRIRLPVVLALGLLIGLRPLLWLWTASPAEVLAEAGQVFTWDFTNTWGGGWLVAHGRIGELYDHAAYSDALRALFRSRLDDHEWSYPPSILLLAVPLAALPVLWAYVLWTGGTVAALCLALRAGGMAALACLAVAAGPAVLNNAQYGQNGALTGALLAGALLLMERRPTIAGVLMGLLTIKPQLGLMLPVVILASRGGRAVIAAMATAAAIGLLTGALFGWQSWAALVTITQPLMRGILEAPWPTDYQNNAVTVFIAARAAGLGLPASYALQGAAAVACIALTWQAWRRKQANPAARLALTAALTLLASPYGYTYDMVALSAGCMALAWGRGGMDLPLALVWLWPSLQHIVLAAGGFPAGAGVIAAGAWSAWRQLDDPQPLAGAISGTKEGRALPDSTGDPICC